MQVKKAWQFLLHNAEKGYFTGYKGQEMFGDLDRAKVFRTHGEAHMASLGIKYHLDIESVLLWHREESSQYEDNDRTGSLSSIKVNKPQPSAPHSANHLRLVSNAKAKE